MAVVQIQWFGYTGWGDGYHTTDINIAPSTLVATVTMFGTSGGGTSYAGIKSYRNVGGKIDFGPWPNWPFAIFDNVTSVTYGLATGANQQAWAMLRLEHWR